MAEFAGYLAGYRSFPVLVDGQGAVRWAHHKKLRYVLPTEVVLHYTSGGTFDANAIYLSKNNERTVSIHFLIGTGGELAMLCPLDYTAYHAGVWARNVSSIGIELVHANDDAAYPEPQLAATVGLCRALCELFGIPTSKIVGHKDIVPTICPRALDLDMIRARVAGVSAGPQAPYASPSPFGVHEACLNWLDGVRGWYVDTVHVWQAGERLDYSDIVAKGHTVIARLNNGYGKDGTIPHPARYQEFANRVGYVVSRSTGCHIWIIGNEPQHPVEWPDGVKILPAQYVDCYRRCRDQIRWQLGHERDQVLLAPVAPWAALVTYPGNDRGGWGDWVKYAVDVADGAQRGGGFDGFALHTYVRRHDPADVTSQARMGAPFGDRYSNFQAYRDILGALRTTYLGKPIYITEFCPVPDDEKAPTWHDRNNGLLQAAYAEIERWNKESGWRIGCLALYRGADRDRWYFGDKPKVREDLGQAIGQWIGPLGAAGR